MSNVLSRPRRVAREGDEEHWIPLSDLMTSLMFLFLLIALAYMLQVRQQSTQAVKIVDAYRLQRDALYEELNRAFGHDLRKWDAVLSPDLTIRFSKPDALFEKGSDKLQPRFQTILGEFFPRYVRILDSPEYRSAVKELRIEGSASPDSSASVPNSYIGDMELSQNRAREVLTFVLPLAGAQTHREWLTSHVTADGLSSSHPVSVNGRADPALSQRVDFRIMDPLWERIAQDVESQNTPANPVPQRIAMPYSIDAVVAPDASPILINLDAHPVVRVNGRLRITVIGWATARASNAPAGGVFAKVDGSRRIEATYGLVRDDVAFALRKPSMNHVGFSFDIPAKTLRGGEHHLDIIVKDLRGKQDYVAHDRLTLLVQ